MIPIADENRSPSRPYVVYGLILVNVLVYIVDHVGVQGPVSRLWSYSMIPASVLQNKPITQTITIPKYVMNGMVYAEKVAFVHQGLSPQWLTIFTSMFMHASLLHIGGNMLYLWIFGNNVEDLLGHAKFLGFYMLCGVIAALAHTFANPYSTIPTIGASGAIAGVLGAYILVYPTAKIKTLIPLGWFMYFADVPAVLVLGIWFFIQLSGIAGTGGMENGGIAYWAHVGGFISGMILILMMGGRKLFRPRRRYYRGSDDRPYPFRPWK